MPAIDPIKRAPEKHAANQHKRRYGEPIENKEARLVEQDYKCANQACRRPITMTTGHQDHDHETGEVRGILCGQYNQALGLLADDPTKVKGLAEYINDFKGHTSRAEEVSTNG
jgi:hypothetical protein